jgi:tRNA(Ile)-lysidine synthase
MSHTCYNRAVKRNPAFAPSDPLLAAVVHAQEQHTLFPLQDELRCAVVVGVSGGADSVCLLHALWQLSGPWHLALHVAHVDHRLRAAAAADADFVAALAARFQLPFHVTRLDPADLRADANGLEAAARAARYTFFAQVARQVSGVAATACVAVAHHAGDQAETLLLRLAQGSGLRGLAALRPVAPLPHAPAAATGEEMPPLRLVRPLLGVQRADVVAYLRRHDLSWMEDETNADTRLSRNYVRHAVLPALASLNPNVVATLARSAELLAAEAERAEVADAAVLDELLVEPPVAGRIVLDLVRWQNLAFLAARRGVLRIAFNRLAADSRQLGYEQIEQIVHSATTGRSSTRSSGPHPLPAGLAWSVVGAADGQPARLCLHAAHVPPVALDHPFLDAAWRAEHAACPLPVPGEITVGAWRLVTTRMPAAELPATWREPHAPWRLYADAAAFGRPALVAPGPGLRIAPFGMGGRHRRVIDVLGSHKIPPSVRPGWPLLVDRRDGRVLWVCGLCTAESLRISAQTREVVCCEWQHR